MQVSNMLLVMTSLAVQVNTLAMAFPKPSVFKRIHEEFAVVLLAFVVLISTPVWNGFFLIVLVQERCTLLTVVLKCFL